MPPKTAPKAAAKKAPPSGLAAIKAAQARAKEDEERMAREEAAEALRVEQEEAAQAAEAKAKEAEKAIKASTKGDDLVKRKYLEQQKKIEDLRKAGYIVPDLVMDSEKGKVDRNAYGVKKKKTTTTKPSTEAADSSAAAHVDPTMADDGKGDNGPRLPAPLSPVISPLSPDEVEGEGGVVDNWMELDEEDPSRNFGEEVRTLVAQELQNRTQLTTEVENDRKGMSVTELKRRKVVRSEDEDKAKALLNKELRSPICCVLGHVDAGKTSLLDKLRRTNVQGGEAGGITQQIGATFFPLKSILEQTKDLAEQYKFTVRIPGLLIIDTPGHESFTNLRSRGSNLCDIAIVVVDLTKGIEPQTRESLNLLRDRKCSFIVAMNKVDRLYGWKPQAGKPIQVSLKAQEKYVAQEYDTRVHNIHSQLMAEGFNSALYYQNKDFRKVVSLVPVSAHSGEGIPDLVALVVQLIQKFMEVKVQVGDGLACTVLEVKKTEGHGTTLDVILVNGTLKLGDTIVACGFQGPIVTTIRSLMTPQPMKELRVKGEYMFHKEVKAALGVKVAAHDLDEAVAGTPLFVHTDETDLEALKTEVMKDLATLMKNIDIAGKGVCVQASTLGSLEALLRFFKENKIPVAHIALGPVHKRHMLNALVALERDPKNAVLLAFDVPITREAQEIADTNNIKIFSADIIYALFDMFMAHLKGMKATALEANKTVAVFPCSFKVLPNSVFRAADPIILGVEILVGQLRIGTPVFTLREDFSVQQVGTVVGVEKEHTAVVVSRTGMQVGVKIQPKETSMTMGRHVSETATFHSFVTRDSIDALKSSFREEMTTEDWKLVIELKKMLSII